MSVRLGKVALGDLEGASGDRLECPELREAEALQVDDDERLSYGPTCGCGRGGEYLGEERLDVHEDRAPVLLGCDVAIEPPGAHRAEALDVHGAAELHNKTKKKNATNQSPSQRYCDEAGQWVYPISLYIWPSPVEWEWRKGTLCCVCVLRTLWKPIGQLSKTSSRPGN